ncbi:MAG: hypothetical protein ACI9SG_002081, partial [Maribacter sp.]
KEAGADVKDAANKVADKAKEVKDAVKN